MDTIFGPTFVRDRVASQARANDVDDSQRARTAGISTAESSIDPA